MKFSSSGDGPILFQFSRFNHGRQGKIIVEDITRIMAAQIEALGGETIHSDSPFIGGDLGYNVILEAFDDPSHVKMITDAHADGCKFIVVATEEPTDDGFNSGLDPAMVVRQNCFPAVGKLASGILHLVPGAHVTQWCSRFAPAAHAELGYAPGLVAPDDVEPDHLFGFYGKMTWRRDQILRIIEAMFKTEVLKITSLDVPRRERDATMRRCRVIVQVLAQQAPDGAPFGMVSSTRCSSALSFGRPIIAEPHPEPWPWDDVVHFSKTIEEFYYDAINATGGWRGLHAKQFERFAAKLTPEFCIGAPLRAIGII